MSIQWPEEYEEVILKINDDLKVERDILIVREYTEGKTDSKVYLADIQSSKFKGQAILKLSGKAKNSKDDENYIHKQALEANPGFSEKYFCNIICCCSSEKHFGILISFALDDFTLSQTFFQLNLNDQKVVLNKVSSELLFAWNDDYQVGKTLCSPINLLRKWLGYRIDLDKSRVKTFIEDECNIGIEDTTFSYMGTILPNPLSFCLREDLWHNLELLPFEGRQHNDFHGYNLIVWMSSSNQYEHKIIDLTEFKNQSFLFYDHSYFELTYLYKYFSELPFQRWNKIVNKILTIDNRHFSGVGIEAEEYGPILALSFLIEGVTNWSKKKESNRKAYIEAQYLLSKVAVGLSFTHKKINVKNRKMAFLFSAFALKALLEKFNVDYISTESANPINVHDRFMAPQNNNWRNAYDSLKHFDDKNYTYVLLTGSKIKNIEKELIKAFGRINWALILDMDQDSQKSGLFYNIEKELLKSRAVRLFSLGDKPQINYQEATAWLMADGLSGRDDTIFDKIQTWRMNYSPYIRQVVSDLKRKVSPQPIVLVVLSENIEPQKLRSIWENIDEVLMGEEETFIFISDSEDDKVIIDNSNVRVLDCGIHDLLSGIWLMKGLFSSTKPQVPVRNETDTQRTLVPIDEKTFQYLKEDLEIVHQGLAKESLGDAKPISDFFRGYEISWKEIENEIDIRRDVTEKLKGLIRKGIDNNRIEIINFQHSPGSGATTVTKRILWDFKEIYPSIRIIHLSANTAMRIEQLFHITKFPVLVVAENSIVPYAKLEKIKNDLLLRNARAVFLYVNRSINPTKEISLNRSMVLSEAERFENQYKRRAVVSKHQAIMKLKTIEKYRLPFFYGLFAFEDQFIQVSSFVEYHMANISDEVKKILAYLSLISRYSQSQLPERICKRHFNLNENSSIEIEKIIGDAPSRLILKRDKKLAIIHPIIAEEILSLLFKDENNKGFDWRIRLGDLSIEFINWITDIANGESEKILEILTQMFINRNVWDDLNRQQYFSELVHDIPNNEKQNSVLENLTINCPEEAHFWNHYGRHHIYILKTNYKKPVEYLEKAIELDPDNEIHYHTLGMVYRNEVHNILNTIINENKAGGIHDIEDALELCDDIIIKAEEQFVAARKIDTSNEYAYITHIQMITETIERLYRISGYKTYSDFLSKNTKATQWCISALANAEQFLRQVKNLQESHQYSHHTRKCEANIKQFYDQFDSMINSLLKLIESSTKHQKLGLRRMVANTIIRKNVNNWDDIQGQELLSISNLMKENLNSTGSQFHDLWIWFQSYRKIKTYSMLTAISEFSSWIIQNESLEGYYYLYILHFLNTIDGISDDYEKAIRNLMKCRHFSANHIRRTYSFEWLSKSPSWCPMIHRSQMGVWGINRKFFKDSNKIDKLKRINGNIKDLSNAPQSGVISLKKFDIFFVPGNDFLCGRDENTEVSFFLGFSYDGLRAWNVKPVRTD